MTKFIKDNGGAIVALFGVCITTLGGILVAIFNKNIKLINIQHDLDVVNSKLTEHDEKLGNINARMGAMEMNVATIQNDIKWIKEALTEISKQR